MNDFVSIYMELPEEDAGVIVHILREKLGFTETDWCELSRPDKARASYGPVSSTADETPGSSPPAADPPP